MALAESLALLDTIAPLIEFARSRLDSLPQNEWLQFAEEWALASTVELEQHIVKLEEDETLPSIIPPSLKWLKALCERCDVFNKPEEEIIKLAMGEEDVLIIELLVVCGKITGVVEFEDKVSIPLKDKDGHTNRKVIIDTKNGGALIYEIRWAWPGSKEYEQIKEKGYEYCLENNLLH
jgi:hypothetical protein